MKRTIVAFGDSNTHGYCSETGGRFSEEERWPCLLEKYLGEEYRVMEEGLSGRTTVFEDPLFEGLSGLSYIFPCLMTHEPVDLLIIMLGTNDTKARFSCNGENISKGLERLVNKALSIKDAWRNGPRILIVAPAPIEEGCLSAPVVWKSPGNWPSGLRMSPHAQAAASWMPEAFRESVCIRMITCIWTGKAIRFLHGLLRNGFLPFFRDRLFHTRSNELFP